MSLAAISLEIDNYFMHEKWIEANMSNNYQ